MPLNKRVARACYKHETKTLVDKWISREKIYMWGIKNRDFLPIGRYISQTIQDSAIVTIEGE